jgi:hypothetical protein
LGVVLTAIDFDHETRGITRKVDDKLIDRHLAAEMEAA